MAAVSVFVVAFGSLYSAGSSQCAARGEVLWLTPLRFWGSLRAFVLAV